MHSSCSFFGGKRNSPECTMRIPFWSYEIFFEQVYNSRQTSTFVRISIFECSKMRCDTMRCNVTCKMVKFTYFILGLCVCLCILYCIDVSRTPRESHETAEKKQTLKTTLSLLLWSLVWFLMDFCIMVYILPNRNE